MSDCNEKLSKIAMWIQQWYHSGDMQDGVITYTSTNYNGSNFKVHIRCRNSDRIILRATLSNTMSLIKDFETRFLKHNFSRTAAHFSQDEETIFATSDFLMLSTNDEQNQLMLHDKTTAIMELMTILEDELRHKADSATSRLSQQKEDD